MSKNWDCECDPCCPHDDNCKDNVAEGQCCCQEGIFEALRFLRNQDAEIVIRGFRPGNPGILGEGRIVELNRDIVILDGDPERVISLCAIFQIRVDADELPDGLNNAACGNTDTNCCCNRGLRRRLRDRLGEEVVINLDDANANLNDTIGVVRLVCDDLVWIQQCVGAQNPPQCNGDFVAIPLCRIAWFEPVI